MAAKYPTQIPEMERIFEETRISPEELAKLVGVPLATVERHRRGNTKISVRLLKAYQTAAELYKQRMAKVTHPPRALMQGDVRFQESVISSMPKRKVPVVGFVAGANVLSNRAFNYSDLANQIEEEIDTDSKDPNALGLIVEGDSMEPEYLAGDRIVVAPNAEPRNRDVVVARLKEEGSAYLKRFFRIGPGGTKIRLESTNKAYEDIVRELTDFRFIYPVVEMQRKARR